MKSWQYLHEMMSGYTQAGLVNQCSCKSGMTHARISPAVSGLLYKKIRHSNVGVWKVVDTKTL